MNGQTKLTGSHGGTTTVTDGGLMRKTAYFEPQMWDAIEAAGKKAKCSAAEIVRRAVAFYLEGRHSGIVSMEP